jgi:hypothetical protein
MFNIAGEFRRFVECAQQGNLHILGEMYGHAAGNSERHVIWLA